MTDRSFSIRFAFFGLVALAAVAAAAMLLAQRNAAAQADREISREATMIAEIVGGELLPGQLDRPVGPIGTERLARAFGRSGDVVWIWSRSGVVRWASHPGARETTAPVDEGLRRALRGRVAVTRSKLRVDGDTREMIEATAPLVVDGRVEGAIEVHRPWAPVAAEVRHDLLGRSLTVFGALVLLYALLFPILLRLLRGRRAAETEARAQEQLARGIVEAAGEGIWVLDAEERITFANPQLEQLLGIPAAEMPGRRIADFAFSSPNGAAREELLLRRADGGAVWTLLSRHAFEDGGAVVLVADIDELKGSERAAHDATRRLSALVAAQREVAELELDLDAALAHVAGKTQELTGADGAAIYVREGDSFVPVVAVGNGRDLLPVPAQASLAGTCASGGVPVVSGDIHTDPRTAEVMRDHASVRSVVMVPMAPDTAPYALIAVVYERPAAFDDVAVETARVMAEFAAAALRNAREHRRNQSLVAALAESEQRFRSAIDSSPIGFALCTTDDRYLLVNDAFCRIAGRTREELELLTWRDLTHPDDLETDRELAERVLSGAIPHYQTEKRFVRPDGAAVWVRMSLSLIRGEDGKPSFGVAQIQDITEPRLLEQSLRERERLFRAVFDQSLVGKILFDDAHRIVDANEAACDLTGLTRREVVGRSIDDFAPPDAPFDQVWEQLERDGVVAGETPVVRPDGAVRIVIFSGRRDVQPGLHLTIVQDMTEQRELEERLRQGQKMEAVGRLAGGIAHDFNNMLTAIGGYAQLLIAGTEPGSGERRHAELIAGAADRAAALTRQLLAFSRRQVLQPAALDPNEVIRHTRELVTRLIGEDVRLETRLLESTEPVFADVGQLEQVIVNLAVNARDAMPRGGVLTIETDTINVDPEQAREAVATPGRYTRLTISDTGVGMDAETLERLFEPFYSTKGDNGTGLGLATVYGIVRQSGGFVTVESEPGRGSSFRILLPATARPATLVEGPSEPEACDGAAPAGETILLVEDEEIVRAIVTEMLEERGYAVLAARDGADAVATAAAHEGAIDLLVSDVVMPGMSGQEVAARIAEARPDVRTLFVSGYSEAAVRGQGVLAPGTSFLEKPFSAEDLARKVRETLDGSVVLI